MNLNNNFKALQDWEIAVKIIKDNLDISKKFLCQELNRSIEMSRFPSSMQAANITPVLKKKWSKA